MAVVHGKDTKLLVSDQDLSQYFRSAEAAGELDLADTTGFGKESHTYLPGVDDGTLELEGMFDAAADAKLHSYLKSAAGEPVTVGHNGLANGDRVKTLRQREAKYTASAPIGDVVAAAVTMQSDDGIDSGVSLRDITPGAGANGTFTSVGIDNGAATTNGGVGHVHVTANTRDVSMTGIRVQHSVDDSTYVDLLTFATVGAGVTTSERKALAEGTTVNRWIRRTHTMTGGTVGDVFIHINFARR